MQQLRQELGKAQQELEHLRSQRDGPTQAANNADLRGELQKPQPAVAAQQATSPDTALQNRVAALEQECAQAQHHIQKLLGKGHTLQAKYEDQQKQKATPSDIELIGRLRLANLDIDRLHKQVKMEANFSQKQVSEVDCLGNKVASV